MNLLISKISRTFDDFLMLLLTVAVVGSLVLVAIGSLQTSKVSKGFHTSVVTDFQLQQINGRISYYDEVLTMSARMAAATGDLSWQERYKAYEPLLLEAIDQAISLSPGTFMPFASRIDSANQRLVNLESRAFSLVEQNKSKEALSVLFSDTYTTQKEAYGSELREWSSALNEEVSANLSTYSASLSRAGAYSMVSFWVLTAAWIALLKIVNRYIRRRAIADQRLRQAKSQLEVSHQELQASEAALQQKAIALSSTLAELQQTQVQIVQSEKMSSLGQLVAGVAHEINNPVNFIHANLEPVDEYTSDLLSLLSRYQAEYSSPSSQIVIQEEEMDIDFIKEDLPKVISSMKVGTERIRQIVLSLRNFSRSDEEGLKTVDIHEGIESTLLILKHRIRDSAGRQPIKVHREYDKLPKIECYPGQLNQVFMNLLANAIDAIEENAGNSDSEVIKEINIHTYKQQRSGEDWVKISIADTGAGIPDSVRDRIFDAFYTTKPVGKGTGMGLSISHTIITQKHRGILSCRSFEGKGTEFIIQLPVTACSAKESEEEKSQVAATL